MSYTQQEKDSALKLYDETESIALVINKLGFPSRQNMYTWIKNRNINRKRKQSDCSDLPEHRRHPSLEEKLEIIHCCFEKGNPIKLVSEETGYSRASIYTWRRLYLVGGASLLISNKKHLPREELSAGSNFKFDSAVEELTAKIKDLELDNDILKETIEILKKDQGIDLIRLKNKEKTIIIDALRNKYSLSLLLNRLNISKSSYCYQQKNHLLPYKYRKIEYKIIKLFNNNYQRYGYRRISFLLKKENIRISEKIVRKIMKENNLVVKTRKAKKYSSYEGEISDPVENIVNRNFYAEKPDEKILTDITEFSIPAGKIYLSTLVDCFDGLISKWKTSVSPNALLVNTMLDEYHHSLTKNETPLIHSDRGCHYRWPGWIERMENYGFIRSMSKKGCSPDNSACEGFFGRMKNEMFYGRNFKEVSIEEFIKIIDNYIKWYNFSRIKESLNYMSPVEYRQSLGLA
ncbi:MAG: IS3 family transposase [Lachnospiraceae bacterium]